MFTCLVCVAAAHGLLIICHCHVVVHKHGRYMKFAHMFKFHNVPVHWSTMF